MLKSISKILKQRASVPDIKRQFIKYVLVGGGAFITEYASFYLLYFFAHLHLGRANALSFCLGLGVSFFLNRLWAFSQHEARKYQKHGGHQFIIFAGLALINLGLTVLIVAILKNNGLDPKFGKLIAMVATSVWNFFIYRKVIFNHHSLSELEESLLDSA